MDNESKKSFIRKIMPDVITIEKEFSIIPIIAITQSALESRYGDSKLTLMANNLLGFTGDSWKAAGKRIYEIETKEFINKEWIVTKRPFRFYETWLDSLRDWASNIANKKRYAEAYKWAQAGDVPAFGIAVWQGGYATDPDYPGKIARFGEDIKTLMRDMVL